MHSSQILRHRALYRIYLAMHTCTTNTTIRAFVPPSAGGSVSADYSLHPSQASIGSGFNIPILRAISLGSNYSHCIRISLPNKVALEGAHSSVIGCHNFKFGWPDRGCQVVQVSKKTWSRRCGWIAKSALFEDQQDPWVPSPHLHSLNLDLSRFRGFSGGPHRDGR